MDMRLLALTILVCTCTVTLIPYCSLSSTYSTILNMFTSIIYASPYQQNLLLVNQEWKQRKKDNCNFDFISINLNNCITMLT